jgi:ADP-ribosyl-[dinitrogen reductase] hydrolase
MEPPFPNCYWLEPDRILCGEYPRNREDSAPHSAMSAILSAGVRVFVDLTEEGELLPYREIAVKRAGELGIAADALEFCRHPVQDLSVPKSPEEMQAILRTIRSSRFRGEMVYLHCWGGIGRTGTVAGCILKGLYSLEGKDALDLLAEHWQACAKSSRIGSPETEEQREFVRTFETLRFSREELFRSALLGAAVGDALGVPVEFQGRRDREKDPVIDMRAFGTHHQPAGTWSDDTSMILATMSGLLAAGTFDPEAVMEQFSRWMNEGKFTPHGEVFDIGIATSAAIRRYRSGVSVLDCGGDGEMSNGNGSLMRILPVALAYAGDPGLVEKASTLSRLTHAHERSRFCCAFYCLVVSELMHRATLREATHFAWEVMEERWQFSKEERVRFDRLHPDELFARKEEQIGSGGHVVDTLEAALWVNERHSSYSDAVLHAVNLGDDTDTTGCVAGGIAGLIYGTTGIPGKWLKTLVQREKLENLAVSFSGFPGIRARGNSGESSSPKP